VTVPNVLTFLRLVAAPVAIGFILAERLEVALSLFVAASVTDAVDGFLARILRQQSRLGAFIDPLADKSLLLGSYLALTYVGRVPGWLTAAIVVRDVLIIAAVVILYRRIGRFTMTPSLPGKVSTFVQMVTAAAVLLAGTLPDLTVPLRDLYYLTAGISVVSGTHYITVGLRLAEEGESLS
jgi:cardiolipin synthase